jgi:hypothetical protein
MLQRPDTSMTGLPKMRVVVKVKEDDAADDTASILINMLPIHASPLIPYMEQGAPLFVTNGSLELNAIYNPEYLALFDGAKFVNPLTQSDAENEFYMLGDIIVMHQILGTGFSISIMMDYYHPALES